MTCRTFPCLWRLPYQEHQGNAHPSFSAYLFLLPPQPSNGFPDSSVVRAQSLPHHCNTRLVELPAHPNVCVCGLFYISQNRGWCLCCWPTGYKVAGCDTRSCIWTTYGLGVQASCNSNTGFHTFENLLLFFLRPWPVEVTGRVICDVFKLNNGDMFQ